MPSYDAIYELLLKCYRERGFLTPKAALDLDIQRLVTNGRTREEAILELNSVDSPWTYSPTASPLTVGQQETEQNVAVLEQIANLREKIDSLTTLFSKGEITQETYLRGVRKLEDELSSLQREHKIPKAEQRRTPWSISEIATRQIIDEPEVTRHRHAYANSPSSLWYLLPILFGLLGGIIGYVGVKDEDKEMADNILTLGIIVTVILVFILWLT